MSAISSISSNSVDLYSALQQVSGNSTDQTTTNLSQLAEDPSSDSATAATQEHHHHHHHGSSGISGQIESAVSSALKNAQPGEDPNQVVNDAIASVLKDPSQSGGGSSTAADSDGQASSTGTSSTQTSQSDFGLLLQSYGIDPKQFQQDFQSAVQQDGSVNFSTLFQSFPPGSAVNTVA